MASYSSSDTFLQSNTTQSNAHNLFPGAYMSKSVGGKRTRRANIKKIYKKKGGDCGCNKSSQQQQQPALSMSRIFGGKRSKKGSTKNRQSRRNKTNKKRQ